MLYWKQIMIYVLAAFHLVYIASLIVTAVYYPAQPIYDLEKDEIVGEYLGVTKTHVLMAVVFAGVSYWSFGQINRANSLGIRPGYTLDILGVNLLT